MLGVFAWVQIKQGNAERDSRRARLLASATHQALLLRRSLVAGVKTLDAASTVDNASYKLQQWEAHSAGMGVLEPRVEALVELMVEREGGASEQVDEVFRTFYAAADQANWLGRDESLTYEPNERKPHEDAARQQLLLCIGALERIFGLTPLR